MSILDILEFRLQECPNIIIWVILVIQDQSGCQRAQELSIESLANVLLRATGEDEGEWDGGVADRVEQYFKDISLGFGVTTLVQPVEYNYFWSGIHEFNAACGTRSNRFESFDNEGIHLGLKRTSG